MNILRLSWSGYQTQDTLDEEARRLRSLGHQYLRPREVGPPPGKLATYDVVLINSQFTVDENFLNQWDRSGLLLTASSGYDHIDLEACEARGVTVGRTPQARADNVSDYVCTVLHLLKRDFHRTGHPDRSQVWDRSGAFNNLRSFTDPTLGILGFGVIGQTLVETLDECLVSNVLVHDPLQREKIRTHDSLSAVSLDELLRESTVLTVHADLNETTLNLFDAATLSKMSENAVLVNSSRGRMIVLEDLIETLDSRSLAGAVLDVLPEEPPDSRETLERAGLYVTPHSAGFGPTLLDDLTEEIVESVKAYDNDGRPAHPVTPRSDQELDRLNTQRDAGG